MYLICLLFTRYHIINIITCVIDDKTFIYIEKVKAISSKILILYFKTLKYFHSLREKNVLDQKNTIYDIPIEIAAPFAPILGTRRKLKKRFVVKDKAVIAI